MNNLPTIEGYSIVKELSKRENCVCFEAKEDKSGEMKVMKIYTKKEISEENVERYKCCLERLRKLSVPHICKVENIKDDALNMSIVMCKYSNCLENINPIDYFKVSGIKEVLKIICECISAFHANGLIYGNLKPSNIMISEESNYYLSDYFCNILRRNMSMEMDEISYSSPEILKNEELSDKSDIWSIGCLIYYLLSGKRIFEGETLNEIKMNILSGEYKDLDNELLNLLINKLLKINVNERISINELKEDIEKINSVNYFPINRFNDLFSEAKDKGDECFSIKDYSKAIEYYNECMKYVSNDVERYTIQKSIGTSYFLLFKCIGKSTHSQEAIKSFQQALNYLSEEENSRKCEIHHCIGFSYFYFGKYTEALESLNQALYYSSEAENWLKCDIYRIIGESYYYLDKCPEALESLQESLNYSSEVENWRKCEIHLCLGESYYYLGKYPEALKSLEEALKYDDDGKCKVEIYFFMSKCKIWKYVSFFLK